MNRKVLSPAKSRDLLDSGVSESMASIQEDQNGPLQFTIEDLLNILPGAIDFDNSLQISINPIECVCWYEEHFDDFHAMAPNLVDALFDLYMWVVKTKPVCIW